MVSALLESSEIPSASGNGRIRLMGRGFVGFLQHFHTLKSGRRAPRFEESLVGFRPLEALRLTGEVPLGNEGGVNRIEQGVPFRVVDPRCAD